MKQGVRVDPKRVKEAQGALEAFRIRQGWSAREAMSPRRAKEEAQILLENTAHWHKSDRKFFKDTISAAEFILKIS